jgi:hypothetical protein
MSAVAADAAVVKLAACLAQEQGNTDLLKLMMDAAAPREGERSAAWTAALWLQANLQSNGERDLVVKHTAGFCRHILSSVDEHNSFVPVLHKLLIALNLLIFLRQDAGCPLLEPFLAEEALFRWKPKLREGGSFLQLGNVHGSMSRWIARCFRVLRVTVDPDTRVVYSKRQECWECLGSEPAADLVPIVLRKVHGFAALVDEQLSTFEGEFGATLSLARQCVPDHICTHREKVPLEWRRLGNVIWHAARPALLPPTHPEAQHATCFTRSPVSVSDWVVALFRAAERGPSEPVAFLEHLAREFCAHQQTLYKWLHFHGLGETTFSPDRRPPTLVSLLLHEGAWHASLPLNRRVLVVVDPLDRSTSECFRALASLDTKHSCPVHEGTLSLERLPGARAALALNLRSPIGAHVFLKMARSEPMRIVGQTATLPPCIVHSRSVTFTDLNRPECWEHASILVPLNTAEFQPERCSAVDFYNEMGNRAVAASIVCMVYSKLDRTWLHTSERMELTKRKYWEAYHTRGEDAVHREVLATF